MSNVTTVIIPEYILKVKISDSRRPTYYAEDSRIPAKFSDRSRYVFKEKKFTHVKRMLLFDNVEKCFIVKNEKIAGKPRYMTIGGNMLYAGMNEHLRMRMIAAIKDDFRRYVQSLNPITFLPVQIQAELHTKPNHCNWDLDNLWIYIKSFQDLLIDYNIIPDDSVRYITKAPGFEFFPVSEEKHRKMIFHISQDQRNVTNHVMFREGASPIIYVRGQYASLTPAIYLTVRDIKSGTSFIQRDGIHFNCQIGIGKKKLLYGELSRVLFNVRYWAIQYNTAVIINSQLGSEFVNYDADKVKALIIKYLSNEGINVIIHNS